MCLITSSMILTATRSLTLPPGFKNSALPKICNENPKGYFKNPIFSSFQRKPTQIKGSNQLTSHPVASERLLILISGVLPMAAIRPLLRLVSRGFLRDFFFFLKNWKWEKRLESRRKEKTVIETAAVAAIPTAGLTAAISLPLSLVTSSPPKEKASHFREGSLCATLEGSF